MPTGDTALKRKHEGAEMTTNDKPLDENPTATFDRTFRNCDVERFEIQTGDIKTPLPPNRASLIKELEIREPLSRSKWFELSGINISSY